jgi:hypothetical protein
MTATWRLMLPTKKIRQVGQRPFLFYLLLKKEMASELCDEYLVTNELRVRRMFAPHDVVKCNRSDR